MAKLITNLETIARITERDERRNMRFRSFIKGDLEWSDKRLDALVRKLFESVAAEIDCTQCANCCRVLGISVVQEDIERLAGRVGMDTPAFEEKYIIVEESGEKMIAESPCPFVDGNLCSVYEDRPCDCRDYPHIWKEDFRSRMMSVLNNAEVCPIVFNVLEQLKERFRW